MNFYLSFKYKPHKIFLKISHTIILRNLLKSKHKKVNNIMTKQATSPQTITTYTTDPHKKLEGPG